MQCRINVVMDRSGQFDAEVWSDGALQKKSAGLAPASRPSNFAYYGSNGFFIFGEQKLEEPL